MVEQGSKYNGPVVIGTGLPRTGTTSLQVALHTLGFAPCSHFRGDFVNDKFPWPMGRRWRAAMYAQDKQERQKILRQIFADRGFNSCTDYPSSLFVEDLVEMYPNAKFVHCERSSPQLWRDSVNESIGRANEWGFVLPALLFPSVMFNLQPIFRAIQARTQRMFGVGLWASREDVGLYHAHNAWVKRVVPKDRLLIFNPKDGYPVLCEFLGVPIPQDEQGNDLVYPHVNDRETMNKGFAKMLRVGFGLWAVFIAGVSFTLNRYGVVDFSQLLKYLK
ncbi:hypothetical protein F5Y08DRAFT_344479 [Xylaria arbuscula]|nr:hypothetical protein F5Y08DRAFT_344479 [Xylaria arbuscula]